MLRVNIAWPSSYYTFSIECTLKYLITTKFPFPLFYYECTNFYENKLLNNSIHKYVKYLMMMMMMMMTMLHSLSSSPLSSNTNNIAANTISLVSAISCILQNVHVTVYYETLCPDSQRFVTHQLYPAWKDLKDHLVLEFVPFGKASVSTLNFHRLQCEQDFRV
jgi:hypothetical protein